MSVIGPLPLTPKRCLDGALGHLEAALHFGRLVAEQVAALEHQNERLRAENRALRGLLVEVQGTFDGVDPVGIDLRDRISEFLSVEPREP